MIICRCDHCYVLVTQGAVNVFKCVFAKENIYILIQISIQCNYKGVKDTAMMAHFSDSCIRHDTEHIWCIDAVFSYQFC